jgi:hypothetical protein
MDELCAEQRDALAGLEFPFITQNSAKRLVRK